MHSKLKRIPYPIRFWFLAFIIFSSLIYSTSLHYAYGPAHTISLSYFTKGSNNQAIADNFVDMGKLSDQHIACTGDNFWKLGSFWGDCAYYIMQAESLNDSIAPYKYRFFPTLVVKLLSRITNISIVKSFVLLNCMVSVLTALLFTSFLIKYFQFSDFISLIGGILFLTMVANTRTIPFPMLEPFSMFLFLIVFISVANRNILLFCTSAIVGVVTKEIMVIASLMWLLETYQFKDKRRLILDSLLALIPIVTFVIVRIILGGSAFEVNYGFNLLNGEFPTYGLRLFHIRSLIGLAIKVFLSFSFLWLGLFNIKNNSFLLRQGVIIPIVILAAILFSSRIARVLGILFPLVIPSFLYFFSHKNLLNLGNR